MPTFDRQKALDQIDGDRETLSLLVSTFGRVSPAQFQAMTQAIDDADARKLAAAAHCLKGSLGVFAAEPAIALTRRIEQCAREEDFVAAKATVSELEREYAQLQAELAIFVNSCD
jgi:HPt (histidine-containing phosphotransfer) domain-containing protein